MPKPAATKAERAYMAHMATLPCLGCGKWPVEVHHILQSMAGKITRRDHRYVVPLCSDCHRGRWGVHGIGSERGFMARTGIDLTTEAERLWQKWSDECGDHLP